MISDKNVEVLRLANKIFDSFHKTRLSHDFYFAFKPEEVHGIVLPALTFYAEQRNTQAPEWLSNVIDEIEAYRHLEAGWDGEGAAAPSVHSMNEATTFIRSLGRGDIQTSLHANGDIILDIGFTALRFTESGMSFVSRPAPSSKEG